MPRLLPPLKPAAQEAAYQQLLRALPGRWFHQLAKRGGALYPLIWGLSAVFAHIADSYNESLKAAIPMLSSGIWLSLHLKSIGLERPITKSDDEAKDDYQWEFKQTRNTRAGLLRSLERGYKLTAPKVRLETDRKDGKLGQFRIVVEDLEQTWNELDLTTAGALIRKYVANGIMPGVQIKVHCLQAGPLPAWQFHDQLPNAWTTMGPIWERPAFVTELRLDIAQNVFAQVSDSEWRENLNYFYQVYIQNKANNAPGALFVYLSDPGCCPYLNCEYDLELQTINPELTFPGRVAIPDGWRFCDEFFITSGQGLIIPAAGGSITDFKLFFSRLQIDRFLDPDIAEGSPEFTSSQLLAMKAGPWTARLGYGSDTWGDTPPNGTAMLSPAITLEPVSIWWTDENGDDLSPVAVMSGEDKSVYLAIEFFLAGGVSTVWRELELQLQGQQVDYRRFSLPVSDEIHTGFIFKVRGHNITQV